MAGEAPALAADAGLDLVGGIGGEVGETAVFEVAPQELHGVEVRRVGRQPDDVAPRMSGQPVLHGRVLVRAPAIPQEDERSADVAREMAEKAQDLRAANVEAWVQGQGEGHAPPPGRQDQGADPGDLLVRTRAYGEQRRLAAWRPRAAQHRHHQEAGFIEADQMGVEAPQFFLPWPSRHESTRAPADHHAPWPAAAVAAG